MTTTDVEALHAALDADPLSADLRCFLADALGEAGSPLADGYLALGRLRRSSVRRLLYARDPKWFNADRPLRMMDTADDADELPGDWFLLLVGGNRIGEVGRTLGYHSRRAADDAAAEAFARLPPERQRELLGEFAG